MALIGKGTVAVVSTLLFMAAVMHGATGGAQQPASSSQVGHDRPAEQCLMGSDLGNRLTGFLARTRLDLEKYLEHPNGGTTAFEALDFSQAPATSHKPIVFRTVGPLNATLPPPDGAPIVTGNKDAHLLFSLRRVSDEQGTTTDTLYAVVPDVREQACVDYSKDYSLPDFGSMRPYTVSTFPIVLAPDNRTIVNDPAPLPVHPVGSGCIQAPDKKLYFFSFLAKRRKPPGSEQWQIAFRMAMPQLPLLNLAYDLELTKREFEHSGIGPAALDTQDFSLNPKRPTFRDAGPLFARLRFSLRRAKDKEGTTTDTLYAVLPGLWEGDCLTYVEDSWINAGHPRSPEYVASAFPIALAANNHEIVDDPAPLSIPLGGGCVQAPDKKFYFFYFLAKRSKPLGSEQWQIVFRM